MPTPGLTRLTTTRPSTRASVEQISKYTMALRANTAGFLDTAHAGNADDHRRKNDRRQQHADQLDEQVAERFEFDPDVRVKVAEQDAGRDADEDLDV